jgi:hypothetical protein
LRGEADAEGAGGDGDEAVAVDAGGGSLQETAVNEGAEEAEDGGLGEVGALDDLGEGEFFTKGAEGFQDLAGAEDGLGFVAIAAAVGGECGDFWVLIF